MKYLMCEMLSELKEIVAEKAGPRSLERVLASAGADPSIFQSPEEAPANIVLNVLGKICDVMNTTLNEAVEAYGEYWGHYHLLGIISSMRIRIKDSKSFILELNELYSALNMSKKDKAIFRFKWKDKNTLLLSCLSSREWNNLPYHFFKGMVRGVAKFYNEDLQIYTGPSNSCIVIFRRVGIKKKNNPPARNSN